MEYGFCLPASTHCFLSSLYQLQDTHLQEHTLGIYIACGHIFITTTDGDRSLIGHQRHIYTADCSEKQLPYDYYWL